MQWNVITSDFLNNYVYSMVGFPENTMKKQSYQIVT